MAILLVLLDPQDEGTMILWNVWEPLTQRHGIIPQNTWILMLWSLQCISNKTQKKLISCFTVTTYSLTFWKTNQLMLFREVIVFILRNVHNAQINCVGRM